MIGFSNYTYPQRREAPVASAAPASPFADFGGSPQAWEADWQRRYDEEAAKFVPGSGWAHQLVSSAPGYDASAAAPWHEEQRQSLANAWDMRYGDAYANSPAWSPQEAAGFRDKWVDDQMRTYTDPTRTGGATHVVRSEDYSPGYTPDLGALNAEKERLAPLAEQQMRQQQAYDWMQGAHQENAVMSPDYANAGFNTITGMSNPYAGPGEISGVDMDWAQGVYDPTTQRGTGTYQPTYQRTGFGW